MRFYSHTFPWLATIQWRARQIFKNRTDDEIDRAVEKTGKVVLKIREERLESDMHKFAYEYSGHLIEHGGWELEHLPSHLFDWETMTYHATREDIIDLLLNWPIQDLPDGMPIEIDLMDVGEELACSGHPCEEYFDLPNISDAEIHALLALYATDYARKVLNEDKSNKHLLIASSLVTEAMDLVCTAEQFVKEYRSRITFIKTKAKLRKSYRREQARQAAAAKLARDPKQIDKAQVRECWELWKQEPSRYKSKAAFARDMMDKFPSLINPKVIEGWCREWDRQRASTVASQPAE